MIPNTAKQHPLYSGYYITPDGQVWSTHRRKVPRVLSQFNVNKKSGYKRVGGKFGNKNNYLVHRLVAETFIPNPHSFTEVNHINGDKTDNSVSNLEWISREDNAKHAWNVGLMTRNGLQSKYIWSVMICATGETFDTLHLRDLESIFNLPKKRLSADYRRGYKKVSTPLRVISRRVVDQPLAS